MGIKWIMLASSVTLIKSYLKVPALSIVKEYVFVRISSTAAGDLSYRPPDISVWKPQWDNIKQLRENGDYIADVDSMGADSLSNKMNSTGSDYRFQTLVATMLSPQTKDKQTSRAFDALSLLVSPDVLSAKSLCKQELVDIENCIRPVSFYTVKAKNILEAANRCVHDYDDDIPNKIEELFTFKGVGPKVAYLTFSIAWGQTLGICVDTHVHRISNRLGWTSSKTPEKSRKQLQQFLPQEYWLDINFLLVGFGQTICKAKSPSCHLCPLKSSCVYYRSICSTHNNGGGDD